MSVSPFEKSRWIWPESHNWDLHNSYALFRKEFSLTKLPARAPLFITADQSYQLYLNGQYVCRGPARGYQSHWPYDELDVRPFLQRGRNVIAVRAHNPGFSNFQYLTQGFAGLLVAAPWAKLFSDRSWKSRRQVGINREAVPVSLQLFCQEHIDLRIEDPNWMLPDFDDRNWTENTVEHIWNGMPWSALEVRGIPMLEENEILPAIRLGRSSGKSGKGYDRVRDVTRLRFAEGMSHQPENGSAEVLKVPPTRKGGFVSYLLDFGTTVVGSLRLEMEGAVGGEIVDTLHVETINAETLTPDFVPDKHCRMAFGHRLIAKPGHSRQAFYHSFGFRYVVITVRDARHGLTLRPSLRTAIYPLPARGEFESADPVLNQIWQISARTQRVCSLDAFVDTPWREQAQWWGDARIQAKNTFFYNGDVRLLRRGIAQISAQRTPEGLTYGHAPTMAHHCILPDFTLVWLLTIWDDYWQTGSAEVFEREQERIANALAYFESRVDPRTQLLTYDPRYWLFLDWCELPREGSSSVYNLWLLLALERMVELSCHTRKNLETRRLSKWAKKLRRALRQLVQPTGLLADGLDASGKPLKSTSVHAQTLAILAGLDPQTDERRLEQSLRPFLRGEIPGPSSYWVTYVLEVLGEVGEGSAALAYIRRNWEPMIPHGTTWEGFERNLGDTSSSHAWSAHPLFHLMQLLGGVRQTGAGWTAIDFSPTLVGDCAKVAIPTPLGFIRSEWHRRGSQISGRLSLPKGVAAKVRLLNQKASTVKGTFRWTLEVD